MSTTTVTRVELGLPNRIRAYRLRARSPRYAAFSISSSGFSRLKTRARNGACSNGSPGAGMT